MKNIFDSLNRLDYAISKLPENLELYCQADISDSKQNRLVNSFSSDRKLKEEELEYWRILFVQKLGRLYYSNNLSITPR